LKLEQNIPLVDEQALFSCAKLVFLLGLNFEQAQFNPNKNPTAKAADNL